MIAIKFILKNFNKIKLYVIMTYALFALSGVLRNLTNYYIAQLFGFIGENSELAISDTSLAFVLIYISLNLGANITDLIRTYFEVKMENKSKKNILLDLFKHTHKHSSSYFANHMSGSIPTKIDNLHSSIWNIEWTIKGMLEELIIPLTISLCVLFHVDTYMTLSILTFFITASVINYFHAKYLKPISRNIANLRSRITGIITDSIANVRLVKNSGAFKHEQLYLTKIQHKYLRSSIESSKETGISNCYTQLSVMFIRIAALSIVIYYWYIRDLSLTDILLSITYANTMISPVEFIGREMINIQKTLGTMEDAISTLYQPFDITDAPNAQKLKITSPNITLNDISFAYTSKKPIFKNFDLQIKAGEKIGLVGLSGAGKSTLINLILRAYDVTNGNILISDTDIKSVTQHSLHQNISLIAQEPSLFNRSIRENISFSNQHATEEEIINAAKLANIHDTILKLPNGYDSIVGERGVKLSGGERQRIAIATAILKNAPILILDEATSALDSESESAIQEALKNIMRGKTVIAIAHRLSTLKNMDRIIVLEQGKISEDGNEQTLLKNKDGLFSHLYNLQSEGFI